MAVTYQMQNASRCGLMAAARMAAAREAAMTTARRNHRAQNALAVADQEPAGLGSCENTEAEDRARAAAGPGSAPEVVVVTSRVAVKTVAGAWLAGGAVEAYSASAGAAAVALARPSHPLRPRTALAAQVAGIKLSVPTGQRHSRGRTEARARQQSATTAAGAGAVAVGDGSGPVVADTAAGLTGGCWQEC